MPDIEVLIRAGCFIGVLILCLTLEFIWPLNSRQHSRKSRWPINLGLSLLNGAVMRFSFGAALYLLAQFVTTQEWGLMHLIFLTPLEKTILGLILLDFLIYLQHVGFHALPLFWRMHQVHHTDLEMDVSTAVRFHPLEVLASLGYKAIWVMAFGLPPSAVLIYEALLNMAPMLHHSRFQMNKKWADTLTFIFITPDIHRIHHSAKPGQNQHNFGVTTVIWDRLFGTYQAPDNTVFPLGLEGYQNPKDVSGLKLLLMPFKKLRT